jgi:hypothetical protein
MIISKLKKKGKEKYHSRMFVWAATGSPLLDAAAQPISVWFQSPLYESTFFK